MSIATMPDTELAEAVDLLIGRGIIALAWLDENFIARWSHGALARWITLGEDICLSSMPFAGMEMRLRALQDEPKTSLLIPNIGLDQGGAQHQKVSIQTFWNEPRQAYLIVIYELGPQAETDRDLFKQLKARRLAEENFRKAREELTEKQHLLDVLIAHAPAAVAMLDRELRYRLVTRRWSREFRVELEPVIGRGHDEMFPTSTQKLRQACRDCLEDAAPHSHIEAVHPAGGKTQWVRWDIQPWSREDGRVGGVIASADILTELMETQRKLEERNAELADLNADLEEFASIIAHDLQSPIRALMRTAQAIEAHSRERPEAQADIADLLSKLKRLREMIADLHDYSRARHKSQAQRKIDMAELIAEIAGTISGAETFDIIFSGEAQDHAFPIAPLDLVLRNLIENAVKHHDRGAGRIEVSLNEHSGEWLFMISDDGPGIDPRDHARIFKPFTKASRSTGKPGSGMGLALVRKTLQAHGGDIEICSDPSLARGTRFAIRWPR